MSNITKLPGSEANHLDSAAQTDKFSSLEKPTIQPTTRLSLDIALQQFKDWRANKKNRAATIPEELWDRIFDFSELYKPITLCSLFGISKAQYNKQQALRVSQAHQRVHKQESEPKEVHSVPDSNSSPFCKIKVVPPQSSYQSQPLPTPKTMIVELCRQDGQIMKIHTTQDSIDVIIKTFFAEDKSC